MDENYARRLRDWLRAEPEAAPHQWLREIPASEESPERHAADRWSVRGQLPPADPADNADAAVDKPTADEGGLALVIPLPRPSRENGCRLSDAEARSRRNHPSNSLRREQAEPPTALSEAEAHSRWNHPSNSQRRDEAEPPTPLSEAESRSRRNHPSNSPRREQAEPPTPLSDAEARSRWNHPSNWHRRRRAAEPPRDEPGSR
ncbi:hypothetical protein [Amycolatopsis solani]|uniref:hypothetical protein n=1 Tax=Amycolatopsis solani TaxID=3028615 RepID=UPI00296F097D|nr:hypothetical protein [Amycolatopsis sp. MEP2-6]